MPDPIFADPRLARIYDDLDADRSDLDHYEAIVDELGARSILDLGCGTGTLGCRLAADGLEVVGVDPAAASLDVARGKPGADRVTWHQGDATTLPPVTVDLVTMTGNVAQVFLSDDEWATVLGGVRAALAVDGHLVFEVRDPDRRAWTTWNRETSRRRIEVPGVGVVDSWVDLTEVDLPLVSFRWTYRFERTGDEVVSDSTLRFRNRPEVERSLGDAGFGVVDVRDAPDRPGLEHVFIARPSS